MGEQSHPEGVLRTAVAAFAELPGNARQSKIGETARGGVGIVQSAVHVAVLLLLRFDELEQQQRVTVDESCAVQNCGMQDTKALCEKGDDGILSMHGGYGREIDPERDRMAREVFRHGNDV